MNNELNINFTSTTYIDKQQPNSNYYKSEKLLCGSFFNSISLNSIYKSLFKFKTITLGNDKYQYASLFIYVDNFKSISNSPITILISKSLVNYNEYTVNWYSAPKSNIRDSISFEITKEDIGTYLEINITPLLSPLNATLENTSFILEPINTRTTSLVQFSGNYSTNPPYIVLYPSIKQISNLSYGATVPADLDSTDDIPNSKLSDFYNLFSQYSKKINSLETLNEDQKDEINNLKEKLISYEELINSANDKINSLTADFDQDNNTINDKIASLENSLANIQKKYTTTEDFIDLKTSLKTLIHDISSLNQLFEENNELTNEKFLSQEKLINSLNSKYASKNDLAIIKNSLAASTDLIDTNNDTINEKLVTVETTLNSLITKFASKNEINILKTSLTAALENINSISDSVGENTETANRKIYNMENSLLNLDNKFTSSEETEILKNSLSKNTAEINSLKNSLINLTDSVNNITTSINNNNNNKTTDERITSLEKSLTERFKTCSSLEDVNKLKASLQSNISALNSSITDSNKSISEKIAVLKSSLESAINSSCSLEEANKLKADYSNLQININTIAESNKSTADKLSAIEGTLASSIKTYFSIDDGNKIKSAITALQNNLNKLNSSVIENNTETSKKLAELQNSIADYDSLISASDEIVTINASLNSLLDKYNSLNSVIKKNAACTSERFVSVENTFAAISKKYSLNTDFNDLKDSVQASSEKISILTNSLEQANLSANEKISSLETAIANFTNNYSPKKQVSNLKSSLTAVTDKIAILEGNLKAISKIDYLNEEIVKLQNDFSSFTENINEISNKFKELAANLTSVSNKADSHDKTFQEIGKLKSSFITLLNSMNELKANFSIIDDKLKYISIEPFEFRDK